MQNKPYLIAGDKTFTLEELYCLLFSPDTKPEEVTVKMLENVGLDRRLMLCQNVDAGTIQATAQNTCDEYPCVELQLQPKAEKADSILLARAEQEAQGDFPPDVYLYGRGEGYIAKMPVDPRPGKELEAEELIQTDLLVSGDPDNVVRVEFENQYVSL